MRILAASSKFRSQKKKLFRSGRRDIDKLDRVIDALLHGIPLPASNRDHALTGDKDGLRECHIAPDWLLIYTITDEVLYLHSTGTHSEIL